MSTPTRWELAENPRYATHFADLIERGEDIDGEARFVDAVAPRNARILDAGSGIGRVAEALRLRGHRVSAVEKDPALIAQAARTFPDLTTIEGDLVDLSMLTPASYDVIVAVGNVMIYLAEGSEVQVLGNFAGLLKPTGRLVVGFHQESGPSSARPYSLAEFEGDASRAELEIQHVFGGYELERPNEEYAVVVLGLPG